MAPAGTALVFLLSLTVGAYAGHFEDYQDFQQLMGILSKPRVLDRNKYTDQILNEAGHVRSIKWRNCGAPSDVLKIKSLTLTPDPVRVPGKIAVSFKASVKKTLNAPISLELTLKKKVLFWVEIPCVGNVGSCSYKDLCSLMSTKTCPSQFIKANIPCHCPIKQGTYMLPTTQITIPALGLPSWKKDGDFQVTMKLHSNGQPVGCFFIQLSVTG